MVSRSALTLILSSREQWETEAVVSPSWLLRRRGMASRTCLRCKHVHAFVGYRNYKLTCVFRVVCYSSQDTLSSPVSPLLALHKFVGRWSSGTTTNIATVSRLKAYVSRGKYGHARRHSIWHFSLCERGVYTVSVNSISVDDYVACDRFPLTSGMRH